MTAFRFYLDHEGHICGGTVADSGLSNESWSLAHIKVVPLPPEDIAWPDGIPFEHEHYVGHTDAVTATPSGQLPRLPHIPPEVNNHAA